MKKWLFNSLFLLIFFKMRNQNGITFCHQVTEFSPPQYGTHPNPLIFRYRVLRSSIPVCALGRASIAPLKRVKMKQEVILYKVRISN
ncbi:MAG: hypothetical protein DRR19_03635 [Candidatus Parabeggiatoa sp. nov. 1]|nr:MAG: hypothetical protein DRR19_03635 [Gammaproteobacteria bacterium]